MPKSKLDRKQEGSYDVHITGQMPNSTDYHRHAVHVEHATTPRDALNQAEAGLNPNLNVTRFVIVFIGLAALVLLAMGYITF